MTTEIIITLMFLACIIALGIGVIKPSLVIRWGGEEKKNRKTVFKVYGSGTVGIFLFMELFGDKLADFFAYIFLACLLALVTGLVNPKIVIRWGREENKNRKYVLKFYSIGVVVSLLLMGMSDQFDESQPAAGNTVVESGQNVDGKALEKTEEEKAAKEAEEKAEAERLAKEAEEKAEAERLAKEAEEKAEAERLAKEAEEKAEAEKYNTGITFEDLARYPQQKKGSYVKFSGEIIQVMNGEGYVQYRMAVDADYDKVVFIEITKDKLIDGNILENDYITIEGQFIDEMDYTTVLGSTKTVPAIVVDNVYR